MSNNAVGNRNTYWAADEADIVVDHLIKRHGKFSIWSENPVMAAWARNIYAYYSTVLDTTAWETSLSYVGEQGELVRMAVPQSRSLIRQLVTLLTKKRLAFNCIAETKGSDVVADVRLGNSVIDQVIEDDRVDLKSELLAEKALVVGISFTRTVWRTDKGKPYKPASDGTIIYSGGVEITVHSPWDVFFQYNIQNWDEQPWVEVRILMNRWDLIAQHPDLEQEILQVQSVSRWKAMNSFETGTVIDDDLIYVYEWYHRPTPAMPKGRMVMYSNDKTIYHDGPNDYGTLPVEAMIPEQMEGMSLGYPFLSNLLPCQEMLDHGFSAIATNQSAFAVQNVTVARGAAIGVQEINGMNFISYTPQNVPGGGKPESLQLSASAPETFKFIDLLYSHMQSLSNITGALRGQPPPGITSGTAIATLTSSALEFISSAQKAHDITMEKTMGHVMNCLKRFAIVPQNVRMNGKNNQTSNKAFNKKDLQAMSGVKIIIGNPVMQTIAGRLDTAEKLIQNGMVKSAQEYIALLEGAPLRQLYETELSEDDLIQSENESLMNGQQVIALNTDDHAGHVRKHKTLLNDPLVRANNANVKLVLDHMEDHLQKAQTADPVLLGMAMTGKMPQIPPAGPQQGGPPGPGAPGPHEPMPPMAMQAPTAPPTSKPAQPAHDQAGGVR